MPTGFLQIAHNTGTSKESRVSWELNDQPTYNFSPVGKKVLCTNEDLYACMY